MRDRVCRRMARSWRWCTTTVATYRIAVMDLSSKNLLICHRGQQDESPSFAPNSDTLIYATRQRGDGVLETVSADGLIRQRMASGREMYVSRFGHRSTILDNNLH